jgi:hypothetical protein
MSSVHGCCWVLQRFGASGGRRRRYFGDGWTRSGGLSTVNRGPSTDHLAAEVGNVSLDTRAGYVGRERSLAPQPSSSSTRPLPVLGSGMSENLEQVKLCRGSTLNRTNH